MTIYKSEVEGIYTGGRFVKVFPSIYIDVDDICLKFIVDLLGLVLSRFRMCRQ